MVRTRHIRSLIAGLSTALLLAGCEKESRSSEAGEGATLGGALLGPAIASLPEWVVGDSTLMQLGGEDSVPEEVFHQIGSAFIHSNGDLIVADRGSSEVRVFNSAGSLRARFGRRGGGEKEFGALMGVWPYGGDSIYTFDPIAQRVGIWTASGEFGRTLFLPAELGPRFLSVRRVSGGFLTVAGRTSFPPAPPPTGTSWIDSILVARLDPTGVISSEFAQLPYEVVHATTSPKDGRILMQALPLVPIGQYAVGKDCFYYSWPSDWVILRFRQDGSQVDTLRFDLPIRRLTPSMIERWVDHRLEDVDRNRRSVLRPYFLGMPFKDSLPAFDRMLEDNEGLYLVAAFCVPR